MDEKDANVKSNYMNGRSVSIAARAERWSPNDAGDTFWVLFAADWRFEIAGAGCYPSNEGGHTKDSGYLIVFGFRNDEASRAKLSSIEWSKRVAMTGKFNGLWMGSEYAIQFIGDVNSVHNVSE